ncbi:hypothetical protein NFB60_12780, partial [Yersinia ruckeri]|nr:hypothetical protein [Yersinia ruckeri]
MGNIINASNISVGGGVQASASIINELMSLFPDDIIFLVSPSVFNELNMALVKKNKVEIISPSPNKINGLRSILQIKKI